ncbi:BA14K family protein [Ensifer aridi]|uniref:BA14K family protein n=1 Tax=Ensifer aridi TaxID=1708715 RepID=UPI00047A0EA7|nr:BA14K family protein [Ensifer aridi]
MKTALAVFGGFILALALFLSGAAVGILFFTGKPAREARLDMNQSEIWTRNPRAVNTATQRFERLPARSAATDLTTSREPGVTATGNEAEEEHPSEPLDTMATASIQTTPSEEQPTLPTRPPDDPDASGEREITALGRDAKGERFSEPLDTTVTSSTQRAPNDEEPTLSTERTAHVEWCAKRYRSYRPGDNSYTPFTGGRRTCISPYIDADQVQSEHVLPQPSDSYAGVAGDPSTRTEDLWADTRAGTNLAPEHISYCFSRYRSYRPEDNSYQPFSGGPRRQCR